MTTDDILNSTVVMLTPTSMRPLPIYLVVAAAGGFALLLLMLTSLCCCILCFKMNKSSMNETKK